GVMSPAGPLKLTVAPGANRRPPSVSGTALTPPGSVVMLPGTTELRTGVVTVKATPLLTTPLTATVTLPVTACEGTTIVREVDVACVTVAGTRVPLAPVKVTALFAAVEPNLEPAITTLPPSGPALGVRVEMAGGDGGGGSDPPFGGADPPPAVTTFTA